MTMQEQHPSLRSPSLPLPHPPSLPNVATPYFSCQRPPSTVSLLIARWKSFAPHSKKRDRFRKVHVYDLASWPLEPFAEGRQVKILAITKSRYHLPPDVPSLLEAYDPHIQGSIIAIDRPMNGPAVITIINECAKNSVFKIELNVPQIPHIFHHATYEPWYPLGPVLSPGEYGLLALERVRGPCAKGACRGSLCNDQVYEHFRDGDYSSAEESD